MKHVGQYMRYLSAFLLLAVLVATGCSKPAPKCTAPEDNPQHHYLKGMELIDNGKLEEAAAKFDRALFCDAKTSIAHSGLAIVSAEKALKQKAEYRQVDAEAAFAHLESASKTTESDEDAFAYQLAMMRVNTALKGKDWLEKTEDAYKEAMKAKVDERKLIYYNGREAAMFFMGKAYLDAREFNKARDSFSAVLGEKRDSRWNALAEKYWKKVDKIVRALAGITVGDVGKVIAMQESVTRGDMAALLIDEMRLEKLLAGRIPVESAVDKMKADFTPADALNSPFKEEILTLMKWKVRGLEPVFDETTKAYLFKPDEPVTRKQFAFVLEDVLIKLTGDERIATAFFGHDKSPYPDVPPTAAWYNAVMNVTTRSIMEAELSGEFRPDANVDGAEAMLAIRVLRQRLNINN